MRCRTLGVGLILCLTVLHAAAARVQLPAGTRLGKASRLPKGITRVVGPVIQRSGEVARVERNLASASEQEPNLAGASQRKRSLAGVSQQERGLAGTSKQERRLAGTSQEERGLAGSSQQERRLAAAPPLDPATVLRVNQFIDFLAKKKIYSRFIRIFKSSGAGTTYHHSTLLILHCAW